MSLALLSTIRRVGMWTCAACIALLAAACTGFSAGGAPVAAHTEDIEAIRTARFAQNEAIATRDADGVAAFWTDDVEIRSGRGTLTVGREAYRQLFVAEPSVIYIRTPAQIQISDAWPLAFETGEWSGHPGSAGAPAVIGGRYSAQWVKRNGRWLIRAEVFVALSCEAAGCGWPVIP